MIRLATDENFNGRIYDALLRAEPNIDVVRAQDAVQAGTDDRAVLAWAAAESRVLITRARRTLIGFAYERIRTGLRMPGLIVVSSTAPIGPTVDDLLLLIAASQSGEWEGQIVYLPL